MPPPPTLSIVTPSFNQAAYLPQTLRSVAAQRADVHEYFVYDAASTDNSVDVIREHAGAIDDWVSEPDKGQSDAIARGFDRATGDYLAWLNSDDAYLPNALAAVRAALAAHPDWDVVSGWHVRVDQDARVLAPHRTAPESRTAARWGVFHPNQPTVFVRRSLYEKVGGVDRDLHLVMDTDLWFRLLDAGAVWGHLPRYLVAFREHPATKTSAARRWAGELDLLTRRYPHYHAPTPRHYAGRALFKAAALFSPRGLAQRRDARRWRGRPIDEIFPRPSPNPAPAA